MENVNETMVMVTREEFEELTKLRIIKDNICKHYKPMLGKGTLYTCVDADLFDSLFPGELEVMR